MRIANILVSDSWGEVSPEAINKGIGGREGALLHLSKEWAKLGHEVTSFVNVKEGKRFWEGIEVGGSFRIEPMGFHEYIPLNMTKMMLANFDWDVAIAWECPSAFNDEQIKRRIGLKICEMQVCHLSDKEMIAAKDNIDIMAVLSQWHKEFVIHSNVGISPENYFIGPNGIDISKYPEEEFKKKLSRKIGNDPTFIYSSSPDRGLWYLLQSWPSIREHFTDAKLLIGYGAKKWTSQMKWSHGRVGEMATDIELLMEQDGVFDIGKIGQDKLSELQMNADAWLYPLDSQSPTESGCITAIENAAAGNPVITTDCDCMKDEFSKIGEIIDLPFDKEKYATAVIDILSDQEYVEVLRKRGRKFAETRDWSLIAPLWLEMFIDRS